MPPQENFEKFTPLKGNFKAFRLRFVSLKASLVTKVLAISASNAWNYVSLLMCKLGGGGGCNPLNPPWISHWPPWSCHNITGWNLGGQMYFPNMILPHPWVGSTTRREGPITIWGQSFRGAQLVHILPNSTPTPFTLSSNTQVFSKQMKNGGGEKKYRRVKHGPIHTGHGH